MAGWWVVGGGVTVGGVTGWEGLDQLWGVALGLLVGLAEPGRQAPSSLKPSALSCTSEHACRALPAPPLSCIPCTCACDGYPVHMSAPCEFACAFVCM